MLMKVTGPLKGADIMRTRSQSDDSVHSVSSSELWKPPQKQLRPATALKCTIRVLGRRCLSLKPSELGKRRGTGALRRAGLPPPPRLAAEHVGSVRRKEQGSAACMVFKLNSSTSHLHHSWYM